MDPEKIRNKNTLYQKLTEAAEDEQERNRILKAHLAWLEKVLEQLAEPEEFLASLYRLKK